MRNRLFYRLKREWRIFLTKKSVALLLLLPVLGDFLLFWAGTHNVVQAFGMTLLSVVVVVFLFIGSIVFADWFSRLP